MFYSNGNYMQDLNWYNQNPNYGYNPYIMPNDNFQNQSMNTQNLIAMYPAIYRIIQPVVSQILSNRSTSYLTEEGLNNLVDTVYSIVEGDINLNSNQDVQTQNSQNTNNQSQQRQNSTSMNSNSSQQNNLNRRNDLLSDLIKIMILNEVGLRNRNNCQRQNMMPNQPMMYM